jgi:peroxiredoxin
MGSAETQRQDSAQETDLDYKSALQSIAIQTFDEKVEAPDFKLSNLEGEDLSLADLEGNMVLLNFWASWCGPCNIEKPSMEKLYQTLKDEGLIIVGVNLREDTSTAENFVEKHDISFPILLYKTGEVSGKYGVRSIPTSYIIGRDGNAIGGVLGAREWDKEEMVSTLKKLLEAGV